MRFPTPIYLSQRAVRWRLSDLEKYEAFAAGEPEPEPRSSETERYLDVKQVAARYSASVPSVWRWAAASRKGAA